MLHRYFGLVMSKYLNHKFSVEDKELVSIVDELPLWSAPFGLSLLDTVIIKKGMNVLDIGSGTGFPLIELAQRLGESSRVFGVDPWKEANERAEAKIKKYRLRNVEVINGTAEKLPFDDSYFDLIVSNNGVNNVEDLNQTLKECCRVSKSGAQFVFTMNLENTMLEFYEVLEAELTRENCKDAGDRIKKHIYSKRKPLAEIKRLLIENGFEIKEIKEDGFNLGFTDGTSMFNYSLIKYWFLDSWKNLVEEKIQEEVFDAVEEKLNVAAQEKGELILSVPYATIDCKKNI